MSEFTYKSAGPVIDEMHRSDKFVRCIRGPIGSGKTVACCAEMFRMAQMQKPSQVDGWRRTRWAVIRNTYRQLETSTIKTWLSLFPEAVFGKFKFSPPFRHNILDPAAKFSMEVYFLALDNEDNTRDLLSTEWTGAFVNEAREIPKKLIDDIDSRLRRFPEMRHGGPTRPGLLMDTNAPGTDHWWPIMAGDCPPPDWMDEDDAKLLVRPDDWEFLAQPPALIEEYDKGRMVGYSVNPKAENLQNLHPDYYPKKWQGKERDWIDVYLLNKYKDVKAGKPVYPTFSQNVHVLERPRSAKKSWADNSYEWFLGVDFGLTPAAVLAKRTRSGVYHIVKEWVTQDMTIPQFGEMLARDLAERGLDPQDYTGTGDPAGDFRDQSGNSAFALMRAQGVHLSPAPTNEPSIRIAAVADLLTRTDNKGKMKLGINPSCTTLISGFVHGYRYRKMRVSGQRYEDKPEKNLYSHIHDALQYLVLGAGEGRKLMSARSAEVVSKGRNKSWSVWGNHGRVSRWQR